MPATNLLQVISAAVTPVVLVSAAAVLILGVNNKHTSLADRIRALTAELRADTATAGRRANIEAQLRVLRRRISFAAMAHRWLYLAVISFLVMVLVLTLAPQHSVAATITLVLFLAGMVLMLAAMVTELLDLEMAGRSIGLELDDTENS